MRPTLDPGPILAALGVGDAKAVTPVSGGWDTSIWRVEHAGGVSALRLFRPEQAGVCRREVLAMRAVAAAGVPVPEVQAEGIWYGHPVLLLAWCPGDSLSSQLRQYPEHAWRLGVAFGQAQAQIHTAAVPEKLWHGAGDWISWRGPHDEGLQARLRTIQRPAGALIHLDYHPLNVVVLGARVTGVLDWANTSVGDPRADLARTLSIIRLLALPGVPHRVSPAALRRFERGWRHGYQAVGEGMTDLAPFCAWAGAVMVRDLAPRVGESGIWLTQDHLDAIGRWTARWRRRPSLPPDASA